MPNNRKRLQGRVVSDKMEKTIVVAIERRKMHRVYKKIVTSTKKVMAHDETNAVPVGAVVRLVETKPLSKRKRWTVEEVIELPGVIEEIAIETDAVVASDDDDDSTTEEA